MADEPRRSGRATKGQHHKDREVAEESPKPKEKGKPKGKKGKNEPEPEPDAEDEEEEEYIRCVCGLYEEEEDSPRSMICCDKCSAWQHNDCMGLPEGYEPEKYFCEQCRPADHKELVAAMKRGEKPWEEVARRRELAEAEKASKKKGGKKARKSGASARVSDANRTPTLEPEESVTSRKRKLEDSPAAEDKAKRARGPQEETNGNARQPSQPSAKQTPQPEADDVAKDVKELPAARKKVAQGLQKIFQDQAVDAVKAGTVKLSTGQTAQSLGARVCLQVEHAIYTVHAGGAGEPNQSYKDQSYVLLTNTKRNPALFQRLANGDLLPVDIAKMQPEDMASEDKKQEEAELRRKLEKQHVMVEQDGPRIRRTHKGEEYVDEARQVAAESTTPNVPVRKESTTAPDTETKSPVATSPIPPQPLRKASNPSRGGPFGDPRRKSSSNFNLDKVWSGVQGSPTDAEPPKLVPQLSSPPPTAAAPAPAPITTTTDPDVDNLLKDEDAESEPYSPKEYTEEGVVWRGRINGGSLGTFTTTAKFAAGCQPDAENLHMTWNEIIPSEIKLHGRIQPSKADDYLCGLQYSNTTELVIVSIAEPRSPPDQEQFEKFFNYLKTKERYGVGMQHQVPAIKDIYLLPMEVGQALPTVMKALEHSFPDPVQERSFLVPVVIKWTELPQNAERVQQLREREAYSTMSPSLQPPVAQTPLTPHDQFVPQFPQVDGAHSGPVNGAASGSFPPQQQPHPATQFRSPPPQQGLNANMPAAAAVPPPQNAAGWAQRLLGPELASCPSVKQLISQAPNAGEQEFTVIRECLLENPEAAHSLALLTNMLQGKHHARREQTQAQPTTA